MPRSEERNAPHHWLCIAQSFAPVNRSGTFRTLGFARHLDKLGWRATVITTQAQDAAIDDSLIHLVPGTTSIVPARNVDVLGGLANWRNRFRFGMTNGGPAAPAGDLNPRLDRRCIRKFSDIATQLLGTPDSRIGWIPFASTAALRILRERPAQIIYSTSPCMSAHLIALLVKRWTGVPWVADFRDPWRDNGFRRCTTGVVNRWDGFLESCVLRHADRIVCNTPTAASAIGRRQPAVTRKCCTILNGIDFDLLSGIQPERTEEPDCFVLAHCGQFYGPRSPRPWFRALAHLRSANPQLAARTRFLSVGCESHDGEPIVRIAQQEGVADLLRVFPHRSHGESLALAAGADAVVVAGATGPGAHLQVPNKLFEYLGLRKPMIIALDQRNPGYDIVESSRARAAFCAPGDPNSIARAIIEIVSRPSDPAEDWSGIAQFDRARRAAEMGAIFNDLVQPAKVSRVSRAATSPVGHLASMPIVRSPELFSPQLPSATARA